MLFPFSGGSTVIMKFAQLTMISVFQPYRPLLPAKNPYAYNKTKILKSVFIDLKEQGNKLIFIVRFAQKRLILRKI